MMEFRLIQTSTEDMMLVDVLCVSVSVRVCVCVCVSVYLVL